MRKYLLDTNIVSYFLRGYEPKLVDRMQHALEAETAAISVVTRAELRYGQALMVAGDKRKRSIDLLLGQLSALPWTAQAADIYGEIKSRNKAQGTPNGDMDTLIAAHALTEKLMLVTHNTRHFENVPGLTLQDWLL